MAAVLYGLLAAALQISGTFSFQYLEQHDSVGPWLNHVPVSKDYRRFRDFQDFHDEPRSWFTSNEQKFDYQLFPSNWLNYKKDPETFIKPSRLGNALSSDSSITSSHSVLQMMKHLKMLPKERRKEQYPNLFLKYRPVVLNTSSLRSSKGVSDRMDRSNIEHPAVLFRNDVQHTSDEEDNEFSTPTLHAKISIDEVANEIPTAPKENKEYIEAEDGSRNYTLVEKDIKNSEVHGGQKESLDIEDKTSINKTVQKEKEEKDAKEDNKLDKEDTNSTVEETTDFEEETAATASDSEEGTDFDGETSDHTFDTTSAQDGKEETKEAVDETSKTTTEVISKNTPDSSSASEDTLTTISHITSTKEVPGNSLEDTTETVLGSSTWTLNETALPVNDSTNETTYISSSDSSPSEAEPSTTKFPVSTKDVTDAPVSPTLSTEITDDVSSKDTSHTETETKFSKSEFVTETTSVTPEHVIDIPSIRKAKIVISVVFLVIGLIAVAILAVYMFRERRKAVKYDQLKLLP